jgi:hypothetical protein
MNPLAAWEMAAIIFGILVFLFIMRDYMPEVSFGPFNFKSLKGHVAGLSSDISVLDQISNRIGTLDYFARRDMRLALHYVIQRARKKWPKETAFITDVRYHLSTAICDNHVSFELSSRDYFSYPKKKYQEVIDAYPHEITETQRKTLHFIVFGSWHMILSVQLKMMQQKIMEYEHAEPLFQVEVNKTNCQRRIEKNKGYIDIINKTLKTIGVTEEDNHPDKIEKAIDNMADTSEQIVAKDPRRELTQVLERVQLLTNRNR